MASPTRTSQLKWQSQPIEDFLQLTTNDGGAVLGGIDYTGTRYGSLAGGGFTPGGDLSGSAISQEVIGLLSHPLPALTTGFLNWTGSSWAFSPGGAGIGGTIAATQLAYGSGLNTITGGAGLVTPDGNTLNIAGNLHVKGGVPYVDVVSYGADPTGVSDSTAAFNAAIAAVTSSGSGGYVYIPWTPNKYILTGTLNMSNPSGNWLVIEQYGSIEIYNPISFDKYTHWRGHGGYSPTSFQFYPASFILSSGNHNAINNLSTGFNFVLENLLIIGDGFQTSAHLIQFTDIVNVSMINVSAGANGTGDAVHVDNTSGGGGFGFFMHGGSYAVTSANINHCAIYLTEIGIVNICPDFIGTYGVRVVATLSAGGQLNITIGGNSPNQLLTEALLDSFLIIDNPSGNTGISGIEIHGVSFADNLQNTYIVKAIGAGSAEMANISIYDVNGHTDIIDPSSTRNITGIWTYNVAGTIRSGSSGSTQYNNQTILYGIDNTHAPANVARGAFVAGASGGGSSQDTHHFIDPVNGSAGIGYTSLSSPTIFRLDSAASAWRSTIEGPTGVEYVQDFITPTQHDVFSWVAATQFDWQVNGKHFTFDPTNGFTSAINLRFTNNGNVGTITGASLSAPQTYTFPNATGTVALLASPAFTGVPTSTTNGTATDASSQIATDAFVQAAIAAAGGLTPGTLPSPATTLSLAPSAGGNFTVAHGLTGTPTVGIFQMTSGGSIYWQTPTMWDGTNVYLTSTDAGVTAKLQLWT